MLNYQHYCTRDRKNITVDWSLNSTDTESNYTETTIFGPNIYQPGSFQYTYNSDGYRCDEFDLPSQLRILFLGCSFTEGIGLPIEATWAYQLLQKIRVKTGKDIPFWSLAVGGAGIDTMASHLYQYIDRLRPRHIIFLRPPWLRRQAKINPDYHVEWMPGFASVPSEFEKVFSNEDFALQQADRSLTIIDLLAQKHNSIVHHLHWQLINGVDQKLESALVACKNFRYINSSWPQRVDVARDNLHPGPKTHSIAVSNMWENDMRNYF
jgi:hypothetical protein